MTLSAAIGFGLYHLAFTLSLSIPTNGPIILALGIGFVTSTFASLLMAGKPIERSADYLLKRNDKHDDFAYERPFRSTLFSYLLMQSDRESLLNYFTLALTFLVFAVIFLFRIVFVDLGLSYTFILNADYSLLLFTIVTSSLFWCMFLLQKRKVFERLRIARFFFRTESASRGIPDDIRIITGGPRQPSIEFEEAIKAKASHDWSWLIDCDTSILKNYRKNLSFGLRNFPEIQAGVSTNILYDCYKTWNFTNLILAFWFDKFSEKTHKLCTLAGQFAAISGSRRTITKPELQLIDDIKELASEIVKDYSNILKSRLGHLENEIL